MQWVIQYMHTAATDTDLVIRWETWQNLEILLILKSLILIFIINFFNQWSFILLSLIQYTDN